MNAPRLTDRPELGRLYALWWFRGSYDREIKRVIERLARSITTSGESVPAVGAELDALRMHLIGALARSR